MHNELPEIFESFGDARRQGFLMVKNYKDAGKNIVGVFCTYTPVEIFMAAGAINVGLCSTSDETIPDAEKVLPRNLCPLIKSSYGFAVTDKCPYMYFSDLVVGETTCDGKKKMYELLGEIKNVHVMQLPQRQDDEASRDLWYKEVVALKERVEKDFQVVITEEDIRAAIVRKNKERILLKEFYELNTACPPPMTGIEQIKFLFGAQFKFDYDEKMAEIQNAIKKVKEQTQHRVSEKAKRILITGCPMGGVTEKVVQVIEEVGGVVVVFENCMGTKAVENLVDESAKDPYVAIAERYLQIGCSVMTPNHNRILKLGELMEQFHVDGVVEMTLQACHTYNIETSNIKKFVEGEGKPFISVETDYSTSDIAQLKTRLAAFIEMM